MGLKVKVIGQRSRSNIKIEFFSLLSEKVRGQGPGQRSSLKVIGLSLDIKVTKNKVKVISWSYLPHRLAGGSTRGRFH